MYFALLCCAVVDLTLSYNYYLSDSEIFVNTESNVEFVNFLTHGVFPAHTFIKFIIALPLLLFIFSWFDVLHDSIRGNTMFYIERFGRTFTITILSLFCISYCCSGFTWYTNSQFLYDLLSFVESMIHGSIMIVLCSLFMLTLILLVTSFSVMRSTKIV